MIQEEYPKYYRRSVKSTKINNHIKKNIQSIILERVNKFYLTSSNWKPNNICMLTQSSIRITIDP